MKSGNIPRVIFLGTPQVAAEVLETLAVKSGWEIVGVVSQPPARRTRNGGTSPSPVHAKALEFKLEVVTPENASDEQFIDWVRQKKPTFCVTAAYGQILTQEFLDIAEHGTLNIHPSLLPLFRGAAPVQRTLEQGLISTGVTIARTVRAMDAGPILSQVNFEIDNTIQAPELLSQLFALGTKELMEKTNLYLTGQISLREQNHEHKTKAAKMGAKEGEITLQILQESSALSLHNKVRAFVDWPGARIPCQLLHPSLATDAAMRIWKSKVVSAAPSQIQEAEAACILVDGAICIATGNSLQDGTLFGVERLQLPGKNPILARDFWNSQMRTLRKL